MCSCELLCHAAALIFLSTLQRVTDEDGNVVSQLCDEENTLGSKEFEQAMRKQAEADGEGLLGMGGRIWIG